MSHTQVPRRSRVCFYTRTVAPQRVPPFVYTPSLIEFDRIKYTALIPEGQDEVDISTYWPDASIAVVEQNADSFLRVDLSLHQPVYGSHAYVAPVVGRLARWRRRLFGAPAQSLREARPGMLPAAPTRDHD